MGPGMSDTAAETPYATILNVGREAQHRQAQLARSVLGALWTPAVSPGCSGHSALPLLFTVDSDSTISGPSPESQHDIDSEDDCCDNGSSENHMSTRKNIMLYVV